MPRIEAGLNETQIAADRSRLNETRINADDQGAPRSASQIKRLNLNLSTESDQARSHPESRAASFVWSTALVACCAPGVSLLEHEPKQDYFADADDFWG